MDQDLGNLLQSLGGQGADAAGAMGGFFPYFTFLSRFFLPALALIVLVRCVRSLLRETYEPEIWGYLSLPNATRVALYHWENIIGRAQNADVVLNYPTLSRNHAALIRDDKARWSAIDLGSKAGVTINGRRVEGSAPVEKGDVLSLGGVEVALLDLHPAELGAQSMSRTKPGRWLTPSGTFLFLTVFQILLAVQLTISSLGDFNIQIPLGFIALTGMMWGYFFFVRSLGRTGFEVEALAFLICSVAMSVIATSAPDEMLQTAAFIFLGLVLFVVTCIILRDLRWAKRWRYPIAIGGVLFLALGYFFAEEINGAYRWIRIGTFTIQPSELVKIAFIFAGAASLDRLFARKNLILFIAYSGMCVGILALMNDFGSAAVFFAAFLVIAYLRSGDVATIALSLSSLGFAAFMVLQIRPHVAQRFATWGNAWSDAYGVGMQQVRTMSSTASGGLFGLGAGEGVLHRVFAADADMVFGIVAEELGLILAFICVAAIVTLAVFAIRTSGTARSSFYVIAAGATVTMFLTQVVLNVFGSLDVIPFTGLTFPFLSRGGSSMLASWGMLAFIKAADNRQNASLAVKLNRRDIREAKSMDWDEEESEYYDEEADYDEYDHGYEMEHEEHPEPLEGGLAPSYFDAGPQHAPVEYWDDGPDLRYLDDEWEDGTR
ncbi:MAG: FtsW/RodA/SpoVE family cell cycle protein [Oscillospiraceae bacterium]|nr:FtsW/RodA/SpoVE family cell cycle protein [Oscillospiraceae bacterium]